MKTFAQHGKFLRVKNRSIFVFILSVFILFLIHFSYAEVLTLSDGMRLAAENSRIVKITEHEESISEADSLLARSRMLPDVNVSLSHTWLAQQPALLFGPQTATMSEKDFLSYSFGIQQTLYDFKGNSSRYEASKAILTTKQLDTKRVRNLVALDFILLFFDLLEEGKTVSVAQKEVERLESHHRDARHLYEEGVITKNDLLQAEVQISDARQRLLTAKNNRSLITSRLNTLLARPLTTELQVMDIEGVLSDGLETDLVRAWETAERQRPEMAIVDETLRSLNFEKTSKQSEYFPNFIVKGGYDYTENRYQVHEGNWSLVLGMNINLFRGYSTKAAVIKIENQTLQLLEQRKKLLDDIKLEVEKYLLDMKNAQERIAVTKDAVQQAEENLRINRLKYEEGVGTATDVIDAVTLLTKAETNYYRAIYDLRRAEGAYLYATGKNLLEVYQ